MEEQRRRDGPESPPADAGAGAHAKERKEDNHEQHGAALDHADRAALRLGFLLVLVKQLVAKGKGQEESDQQGPEAEHGQIRGPSAVSAVVLHSLLTRQTVAPP